ncbi:MAG: nucleoside monophosphate kinase [archaeon]|nr:nucleoside monophosphate kinase [archaeon]
MASKYIKLFKIPSTFEDILNDFAREVLRNQPEDIIEFGAEYFKWKDENREKEKELLKGGYKPIPFDYSKKGENTPANFIPHKPIDPRLTEANNKLKLTAQDIDRLKATYEEIEELKKTDKPLREKEFGVREGFGDIVDNPKQPVFEDDGYVCPDPFRDLEREAKEREEEKQKRLQKRQNQLPDNGPIKEEEIKPSEEVSGIIPSEKPKVLFIVGAPCVGKGTQCFILKRRLGCEHLSTGDILRAVVAKKEHPKWEELANTMNNGGLVSSEDLLSFVKDELSSRQGKLILLDGFPRNAENMEEWRRQKIDEVVDVVGAICFECPEDVLMQRCLGRNEGRADDNEEAMIKRIKVFNTQTIPAIEALENVIKIDANRRKREITRDLFKQLRERNIIQEEVEDEPEEEEVKPEEKEEPKPEEEELKPEEKEEPKPEEEVKPVEKEEPKPIEEEKKEEEVKPVEKEEPKLVEEEKKVEEISKENQTKPQILFIVGGPGCGKNTNCHRLVKQLGCEHLSTGDILRAIVAKQENPKWEELAQTMQNGGLVSSEDLLYFVKEELASRQGKLILLDGFPRNAENMEEWKKQKIDEVVDLLGAIYFECPEEVLTQRCLGRNEGRADDNEEAILKRIEVFKSQTVPIIESLDNLIRIDSNRDKLEIAKDLFDQLKAKNIIPQDIEVGE